MNKIFIALKKAFMSVFVVLLVFGVGYLVAANYSWLFRKKVVGVVDNVERVKIDVALIQQNTAAGTSGDHINPDLFSFAVAIKDKDGNIFTSSANDRQWAVVRPGQCVEADFYPYPPWQFEKSGTYFNARLLTSRDCP